MEGTINQFDYKQSYKRNLPHLQPPQATLFVTFRLDGSVPEPVLEQWRIEKKRLETTLLRWTARTPEGTLPDWKEMVALPRAIAPVSCLLPFKSPKNLRNDKPDRRATGTSAHFAANN
jgi:hypothetical protein